MATGKPRLDLLYNAAHPFPEANKSRSNQGIGIPWLWLEGVEFAAAIDEFMLLKFEHTSSLSMLAINSLRNLPRVKI